MVAAFECRDIQHHRGEVLQHHVLGSNRTEGRHGLDVSSAAVTDLDRLPFQFVRRHEGAELFMIALATERTAEPLGPPVTPTASASKMPGAVEPAHLCQRRPATTNRAVA